MAATMACGQTCTYPNNIRTADGKIIKPSRKVFERQCLQLADEIHVIHTKLASNKAHLNELFSKLDKLRAERNAKFADKSLVEGSVQEMSGNINKLSEKLAQLQSKLHYRDMKKLEDAIRTLQIHLDSRHFKHSEEKKIVAEIDKLNRSRKVVGEFLNTQAELKELRSSQHSKRADRDKLIKDIVTIRKQEEDTRGKLTTHKDQEAQLKAELEAMSENKKSLKAKFTEHQQTFAEQKAAMKEAEQQSRQKQRQQLSRPTHCMTSRCLSNTQTQVADKPQTQEIIHCQQLLEFCQRLTKQQGDDRAMQRQKKKKISYTPDLLSQFVSVNICPPMTVAQAGGCIPLLQQKLIELRQAEDMKMVPLIEVLVQPDSHSDDVIVPSSSNHDITTMDNEPHLNEAVDLEPPPPPADQEVETEQPDDQSDRASLGKQLSNASNEDTIESISYKLSLLESLCLAEDRTSSNNFIA